MNLDSPSDFTGKVAVVTGGAGFLCSTMASALSNCGTKVAILDINLESAERVLGRLHECGHDAIAIKADVLDRSSLEEAAKEVIRAFGRVDILINGAGGNRKEATTSDHLSFFDLPSDAIRWVFDLNILGVVLTCQAFVRYMVQQGNGCIINISSMAAIRPLTRTVAYSAAKAAVSNFTQWLAVHISQNYSKEIRVNAIAPGFFLTEQNRFLLVDETTGNLTERGQLIIKHTPMERFGNPDDLVGTVLWLASEGASFINGVVIPVDGGFSAFSGV